MYKKGFDSSRPLLTSKEFSERSRRLLDHIVSNEQKKKLQSLIKQENDAWNLMSEEEDKIHEKLYKRAYEETYNYLKKNNPEYLEAIEKQGGNLDQYHDFDVIQDGFADELYDSKEFKQYTDKINRLEKEFYKCHDEIETEGHKIIRDVLNIEGPTRIMDIRGRYSIDYLLEYELKGMLEKKL